ncbi:MAG: autotransporter outer membrane beta-barrel domain-containing protein [Phenylobacterium sp.]|uniref:autotransporter outer membrane beta-barrel domain-containing protein n=1 Tax=Phenylobacterium sp. TaxID=1871053 RepID=UPI002715EC64|nr:autotransporter outer membrane beta-barrel domain-containing protein [Phenylobacterium sp.]MDO8900671.1 autotransporter outer membrane beta-barrel domain-containing protein [Phenylobacterium sp.]
MDRRWLSAAAIGPLILAAGVARAETVIGEARTTPVTTATAASGAPDNLRISSAGSVKPAGGAAVTLNSDNSVAIEGEVVITDANDATALLVEGGRRGEVVLSGVLRVDETYEPTDSDSDGDLDGPFATGVRRFGVRVTGSEAFHGSIVQTGGSITVEGNDSAGILAESAVDGPIRAAGSISVLGDRSYGIRAASTVGGDVVTTGGVVVQGAESVGVAVDGHVGGTLILGGAVTATGYRYTTRPADVSKLDADDLLQGGPAVRVRGSVQGGVLVDAPPADNDPDNDDEDGDGVPDASESTGVITSYGAAAGLQIGGAEDLFLGTVGGGGFGLVVNGTVQGVGLYDGVRGLGIEIGGQGGAANITGGIQVGGLVSGDAVQAGAVGLHLKSGATAPVIANSGTIRGRAVSDSAVDVRAIQIDVGAAADRLTNHGTIFSAITGAKGSATAVLDAAGTLSLVENTGLISAAFAPAAGEAVEGRAVALDLRANTTGVTVRQSANASETVVPTITGDVLFGSGPARMELLAGQMTGALAFGGGADNLTLNGGATYWGALSDAGGGLAITVGNGRLTTTNTGALSLDSLSLGSDAKLVLTADPVAGTASRFDVAGQAVVAEGAQIGLRFTSKLTGPASFTLIQASDLQVSGALNEGLLAEGPWLYRTSLRVDEGQDRIIADVRRRSAEEAGLGAAHAGAYEAVFEAFDRDAAVRDALLSKTDAAGFNRLYNQFLPDYSGALFRVIAVAQEATARGIDETEGLLPRGRRRGWAQEIGVIHRQDLDGAAGFEADGFGFAAGVEGGETALGTFGIQTSFLNVNVEENGAAAAETLSGSTLSAGVYWRASAGGLQASAGATGGYAWFKGERVVADLDAGLSRTATSDWNAALGTAHLALSWTAGAGRYYVRPMLRADYVYLGEDGRTESGGGEAVDLAIEDRTGQQLAAFAGLALGATFGDPERMLWRPEVTAGYRALTGDGAGATTARFVSGGPAFTLTAPELDDGAMVVRLGVRGLSRHFDLALEGGGELRGDYQAYDARVTARLAF